ncbi:MAG: class I mannose-6-phosphate isomerase [Deltaproteobacteria bacterium]|nr:class I mannose-6-phosphate isomerase [Deltaproteobacteria bacterium]
MGPVLLRADNFTPPARTPWGGRRILEKYKAGLGIRCAHPVVGESWEISVEPSFPSRLAGTGELLGELIARDPLGWLGDACAARFGGQTPLLVKLLDAGADLSIQVHPEDGDPALGPDESGKPESWLVLDAAPGAGLYLGLGEGVDRRAVQECLAACGPLERLLNFVPVHPGDVFVIPAGTAHAIGAGVTLIEPQHVAPGRRGVTYRFWDYGRRYDAEGRLDPHGEPRALHVERSLGATDWDGPRGAELVASCRAAPHMLERRGEAERRLLADWRWFVVERWTGTGALAVPAPGTLVALTCVGGAATVSAGDAAIALRCGQSALVPAAAGAVQAELAGASVVAVRTPE